MAYKQQDVNPDFGLFSSKTLDGVETQNTNASNSASEVLNTGVPQIDSNLLAGGVKRGSVLNVEVFDSYFKKSVCFFSCKMAMANKKVAIVTNTTKADCIADYVEKYVAPLLKEQQKKNIQIIKMNRFCLAKNFLEYVKSEGFDFLLLCDFWRERGDYGKVKELAILTCAENFATFVLSPLKNPSWSTAYRDRAYPALSTLEKYCTCNILIRPVLQKETHYADKNELRDIRKELGFSASRKILSEILFSQIDEKGVAYKDRVEFDYARGYLGKHNTHLSFYFQDEMPLPQRRSADNVDFFVATLC